MTKVLILACACLALAACGNKTAANPELPAGYEVRKSVFYYTMSNCIQYARQESVHAHVRNENEAGSGDDRFVISGTLENSGSVLFVCTNGPAPNATFTMAVKPVDKIQDVEPAAGNRPE